MDSYAPLILNKLEVLELNLIPNKTKDLETTIENPLNTKMDLAQAHVVDTLVVAGVTLSVSGMEIAVMISMMSVALATEIVVVTEEPDAGVIPYVPDTETVASTSTTYVAL